MATDVGRPSEGETRVESLVAMAVGGLLVVVAVLAPLVAGPDGEFFVFGRNYLHDAVHLGTGLLAFGAGYLAGGRYANPATIGLGAVYLLVALLGIALFDPLRDLLALNTADNALHMLLAVVLLGTGLVLGLSNE